MLLRMQVRSFEHLVYLTSLKALVLAGAQPVKLQCLGALTQLEALSLAGLQKPPIYEANGEAELVAAVRKLKALRCGMLYACHVSCRRLNCEMLQCCSAWSMWSVKINARREMTSCLVSQQKPILHQEYSDVHMCQDARTPLAACTAAFRPEITCSSGAGLLFSCLYEASTSHGMCMSCHRIAHLLNSRATCTLQCRVLDVRHAHAPPHAAMLKLPSLCLLGLHDTAAESVVGKGAWKQHANVDMVAAAEAAGWPLAQSKRTRLCSVILHHAKRLGRLCL